MEKKNEKSVSELLKEIEEKESIISELNNQLTAKDEELKKTESRHDAWYQAWTEEKGRSAKLLVIIEAIKTVTDCMFNDVKKDR